MISLEDRFIETLTLLEDEKSKTILTSWFSVRGSRGENAGDGNEVYFPIDLPKPREPLNFIDIGAFTGDTISQLVLLNFKVEHILAIEPNVKVHKQLYGVVKRVNKVRKWPIVVCGSALGNGTEDHMVQFRHQISSPSGSHLCYANYTSPADDSIFFPVTCITLDMLIQKLNNSLIKPNFIKVDAEAYEYEIIEGSEQTIKKYRPRLAVAVYHVPWTGDRVFALLKLPQLIRGWGLDYKFYLRVNGDEPNHRGIWVDLILYCIPKEKGCK